MSFRAKAYALAFATSFTHVLLLDSDNLPLADLRPLFRLRQYREHGNLFWCAPPAPFLATHCPCASHAPGGRRRHPCPWHAQARP